MSYMALYRKWRPATFDEVKGQDAIVRTLRNQILYNRIGHAYLFCGTRGTGKTSIAKLFARAVNCENPQDGNPCGQCPSCQAISTQSSFDVIEIDAASNNGVDHIREIREQVQYPPVNGRYKVYIIDEVHMLSGGAFNALLKTLEEPPAYVIFILATTEKHKIPVTILSRCQKYDFRRISADTISDHLAELMEKEGIDAEDRALRYVARAGDGSMRDALSLLDQCISFYLGETLTYDHVLDVLGTVDTGIFQRLLFDIVDGDTTDALKVIDEIMNQGRELSQFLNDFLWYLRNLLLLQDGEGDGLDLSEDTIRNLKDDAYRVDTSDLLRYIRIVSQISADLRNASAKRVILEIGIIKLCRPQMESDTESLLARIQTLEKKLEDGPPVQVVYQTQPQGAADMGGNVMGGNVMGGNGRMAGAHVGAVSTEVSPEETLKQRFAPAQVEDLKELASNWNRVVDACSMPMSHFIKAATPMVSDDSTKIILVFRENEMAMNYFEQDNHSNLRVLSDLVAQETGKEVTFECIGRTEIKPADNYFIDLSKIHHTIIYE